jgi:Bax protein
MAMKPHPQSITIAQAAMESAWGTSRFFKEANNIFGMWSVNSHEPRIAAGEQRGGKKTIYLKKFNTLEDSVRAYYLTLSRAKTYKKFRQLNYETDNPYTIINGLVNYSEKGEEYVKELAQMIRYNKLTNYDKQMQLQ